MDVQTWVIQRKWPNRQPPGNRAYEGWNLYADDKIAGVDVTLAQALDFIQADTPPNIFRGEG